MRNSNKYNHIDFSGTRHGKLTVIEKANHGRTMYICKCDCGTVRELSPYYFLRYKSCGCAERENKNHLGEHNVKHGMTDTRLYRTWCKMKERCYNPNIEHYPHYGGRGIKVCEEWKNSFETFRDWAYSVGFDENSTGKEQSIDRIDTNGNYEPNNCRWINHKEQCRNRTNNVFLVHNGRRMTLSEFCETYGITYIQFVVRRLAKGISSEQIISDWKKNHPSNDKVFA